MDIYTIQMKNLHKRYGLSKNMMLLLTELDTHRYGTKDPEALGRWLRMNLRMRKACTDTITSLAEAMQKNPTPDCVAECTSLITCCADMLKLASKSVVLGFPFFLFRFSKATPQHTEHVRCHANDTTM